MNKGSHYDAVFTCIVCQNLIFRSKLMKTYDIFSSVKDKRDA